MINGVLPSVRVAIQTFFSPQLTFAINDPEEFDEDAIDVEVDEDKVIRNYYSFHLSAARTSPEIVKVERHGFALTQINEVGISVGLNMKLSELLNADESITFAALCEIEGIGRRGVRGNSQYFADGVLIELDERWVEEKMRYEPQERDG